MILKALAHRPAGIPVSDRTTLEGLTQFRPRSFRAAGHARGARRIAWINTRRSRAGDGTSSSSPPRVRVGHRRACARNAVQRPDGEDEYLSSYCAPENPVRGWRRTVWARRVRAELIEAAGSLRRRERTASVRALRRRTRRGPAAIENEIEVGSITRWSRSRAR